MPTYQYACSECDHAFEQVQSFSDDSLTVCPACSGRLRKVYNAVGVVFKGSGFYRTDSRAEAKESAASGAEPKAGTKDDTKSDTTKSDTKSDTKSETKAGSKPSTPAATTSRAGAA